MGNYKMIHAIQITINLQKNAVKVRVSNFSSTNTTNYKTQDNTKKKRKQIH